MAGLTRQDIEEIIADYGYDEILLMDGFDSAFVGITQRHGLPPLATYSYVLMLKTLVENNENDPMTLEEAEEYINYNCLDAWVGENTPLIVMDDMVAFSSQAQMRKLDDLS